jgi:type IV pilus assembly protein PilC
MFFSSRISTRQLAGLCRRMATSLTAGIDIRSVLAREADRPSGGIARAQIRRIRDAVNRGESLGEALAATGDYFPVIFREMAAVGEQTGHLDDTLAQLADHYDFQLSLRRGFWLSIIWPLVELGIALAVIGFLIWILGVIGQITGTTVDILGFGLVGNRGLAVYLALVGSVGLGIACLLRAINRGLVWTRPIQKALLGVPVLGQALLWLALARLAWSLHLTLNAGMEIRRAVSLALRNSGNARFTDHAEAIDNGLRAGDSLYEIFRRTGAFPPQFLDSLHVGEETGNTVEVMARLSRHYRDQAESSMRVLAVFGFFAVFGLVALFIILMIFRLASFYIGTLNDALRM